ncbi:MAG: hypothetical protein K2P66_08775 [Lachnospiraceae bacterium]|nr:hypothetical protein [Lachnospiraceae bacterium]
MQTGWFLRFLVVRRLRCLECERISHELPDIVVPYKHHELDTIADGLVEDDSLARKSCPAEVSTINRWKHWFFSSHIFFEESLRTLQEQSSTVLHLSLPLFPLNCQPESWLRTIVYYLVNSGAWRHTRFA